jgi:NADPH:quinone reductase-like Zn-dependent oxidoreductase
MRALLQHGYGSGSSLTVGEAPVPTPDEASVLVKVQAASINALDWRMVEGKPFLVRFSVGLTRPKRAIRGVDVSGRVEQVRKSDSRFKVGDEVFGLGSGSFAEFTAADESELVHKPPSIPFADAATLGVAAFTALQGLRDHGEVQPGQSVLITGAGSGVGTFAIQIAKSLGARVTAVASTRNVELARSLGAEAVIDYTQESVIRRPDRFDLILDISGRDPLMALHRRLTPQGRIVMVGIHGGIGRIIAAGLLRRIRRARIRTFFAKTRVEDLRQLAELVVQGRVKPVIDRVYPLEEGAKAMTYVETHQVSGKVVLQVA